MPESQPEIERLAPSTQTKLRSTQILTSLPQIVSELVQNSLDANPSQIHVGLDCKEWTCWVQDDGHGISKEGLETLAQGEDGRRYRKPGYAFNSLNDYLRLLRNLQNILVQVFQFEFCPYLWFSR